GSVRNGPLSEQPWVQLGFRAPLDRFEDWRRPHLLGDRSEGGEGLPAIEGPRAGAEAVPAPVTLLVAHEPFDRRLHPRILLVTEPGHHADRVPGNADLARADTQITGSGEAVQEVARSFGEPRGHLRV